MKLLPFALVSLMFLKYSDIHAQTSIQYGYKIDYCRTLDSLNTIWNTEQFPSYANKAIPMLEKASGIKAHCNKGYFGHIYFGEFRERAFNSDIINWRKSFKCVAQTILLRK